MLWLIPSGTNTGENQYYITYNLYYYIIYDFGMQSYIELNHEKSINVHYHYGENNNERSENVLFGRKFVFEAHFDFFNIK